MILKNTWKEVVQLNNRNYDKDYNELIELLDKVPGVQEHMNSLEVQLGKKILQRRIKKGLTQSDVVDIVLKQGERITQKTISKVENGDAVIESNTYKKIFKALGVKGFNIDLIEESSNDQNTLVR